MNNNILKNDENITNNHENTRNTKKMKKHTTDAEMIGKNIWERRRIMTIRRTYR